MPSFTSAAKVLETARLGAGLSQRELARRAGTSQSVIARIEAGQASPRRDTLVGLVRAAGFELRAELAPMAAVDTHMLSEVSRILSLSPEDRIREVAAASPFCRQCETCSMTRREGKEPAHVHVQHGSHYAKFWLSPVSLARTGGFRQSELGEIQRVLRENREYLEGRYHEHIRKLSSLD